MIFVSEINQNITILDTNVADDQMLDLFYLHITVVPEQ